MAKLDSMLTGITQEAILLAKVAVMVLNKADKGPAQVPILLMWEKHIYIGMVDQP